MKALETISVTIMEAEKVRRVAANKERKKEPKKGGDHLGARTRISARR